MECFRELMHFLLHNDKPCYKKKAVIVEMHQHITFRFLEPDE